MTMTNRRSQRPLRRLTRDHQAALAKVAALAARGVLEGGKDRRHEDYLKYQLDQLTVPTGSPAFGVGGTSAPAEILLKLGQEGREAASRRRGRRRGS